MGRGTSVVKQSPKRRYINPYKRRDRIAKETEDKLGVEGKRKIFQAISVWRGEPTRVGSESLWSLGERIKANKLTKATTPDEILFNKWYEEIQQPALRAALGDYVVAYRGIRGEAARKYDKTGRYNPKVLEDWTLYKPEAEKFAKGTAYLPEEHRREGNDYGTVVEAKIPINNILASYITNRLPIKERNIIVVGLPEIKRKNIEAEAVIRPIITIQSQRSERARIADASKLAKVVVREGDKRWLKHPNRYDIRGIDTPPKINMPKAKLKRIHLGAGVVREGKGRRVRQHIL